MMLERSSAESRAMAMLRFPLACLIVLLHTGVECGPENVAYYVRTYFTSNVVVVAVPAFFFMSGYLFFMGHESQFAWTDYVRKMKRKVRTLLVPYLLWNLIALCFSVGYNLLKTGGVENVCFNPIDVFWAHGEGITGLSTLGYSFPYIVSPCAGVLWFLRDLMMMMVISILCYPMIKRMPFIVLVIALLAMNYWRIAVPFAGFSMAAITWFYLGAWLSVHGIDVFRLLLRYKSLVVYVWPLCLVLSALWKFFGWEIPLWGIFLNAAGIASLFCWAYLWTLSHAQRESIISKLGETSFFIYAFAGTMIVWFVNKEIDYFLVGLPYVGPLLDYIVMFTLKIVECVMVYYGMKRYCPQVLSVLVGGRVQGIR